MKYANMSLTWISFSDLVVLDEKLSRLVVYHLVQRAGIERERVIIVKAVDVHLLQIHLIVGIDCGRVQKIAHPRRNQICGAAKGDLKFIITYLKAWCLKYCFICA